MRVRSARPFKAGVMEDAYISESRKKAIQKGRANPY
jgi:hypothetical protein